MTEPFYRNPIFYWLLVLIFVALTSFLTLSLLPVGQRGEEAAVALPMLVLGAYLLAYALWGWRRRG